MDQVWTALPTFLSGGFFTLQDWISLSFGCALCAYVFMRVSTATMHIYLTALGTGTSFGYIAQVCAGIMVDAALVDAVLRSNATLCVISLGFSAIYTTRAFIRSLTLPQPGGQPGGQAGG